MASNSPLLAIMARYNGLVSQNAYGYTAMQVNILEAKNRLSQLIKSAQAGEEIIIANRGQPMVRLVPTETDSGTATSPGNARAILDWLERHPLPAYARRSAEEIDAAIREERDSWD